MISSTNRILERIAKCCKVLYYSLGSIGLQVLSGFTCNDILHSKDWVSILVIVSKQTTYVDRM